MNISFLKDAYRLIDPAQRKRGIGIVLLLVVSSVLDFFSIAFFLPLLFILIDPITIQTNFTFQAIYTHIGFQSLTAFAITFTVFVFVFIVFKTIINSWITFKKARFAYEMGSDMAGLAVNRFLTIPYQKFTQADLSHEVNILSNMPLVFANNIIIPIGTLLSETLLFTFLLLLISLYNIKAFTILLLLLLPVFLIYQLRRKKIKYVGASFRQVYPSLLKHIFQITEGLPDIRAFVRELTFQMRFKRANKELVKILSSDHALHASIPRLVEVAAAGIVCAIIGYTLLSNQSQQKSLLLLSLYAGSSFRMVPSINRILASIQQIKVHEYSAKEFIRILEEQPNEISIPATKSFSFEKGITIQNISFGYPGQVDILNSVNLYIPKGQRVAFTGKSGAGKTTFILLLLRFLKERSGSILVDGRKLNAEDDWCWRKLLGYVPQNPYIMDGSIVENIAFGIPAEEVNIMKIEKLIFQMDLSGWVSMLENGIQTNIGEKGTKISGGQRQRIAIARALYHEAEILLLDEVTNQLDPQTEKEVIDSLLKISHQSRTIVMITHHPELLKKFDAVYCLAHGAFENINFLQTE